MSNCRIKVTLPHDVPFNADYIPYADLVDLRCYVEPDGLPAVVFRQPALRAEFDTKHCLCSDRDPGLSYLETVASSEHPMLAICHQLGPDLFVALADLLDPRLWPVLDQWNQNGQVAIVQTADSRPLASFRMGFQLDAAMLAHRPALTQGATYRDVRFTTVAGMFVWTHVVGHRFSSRIAQYPVLNSVNFTLVRPDIEKAAGVDAPVVVRERAMPSREA